FAILILDRVKYTHCGLYQKRQRTSGCAGNDGAVDRPHRRRTSPDNIALLRIRSRDAPQIVTIVWKLLCQCQAKTPMHIRCDARVLKVIGILIALFAKIEPRLRVLVYE